MLYAHRNQNVEDAVLFICVFGLLVLFRDMIFFNKKLLRYRFTLQIQIS